MKRALLVGAIAVILSPAGHAQQPMRLNVFMTTLERESLALEGRFFDQIVGAARGFTAANQQLILEKAPPLYCPPGPIRESKFVDIALQEYRRNQIVYDNAPPITSPVDVAVIVLLRGLMQAFPCK
jgi:hypothetical protein